MTLEPIERSFREKVCDKIRLEPEGIERFRVFTPFQFDDGDHLSILLKQLRGQWVLSDEGYTYMHLSYDIDEKDLQKGTRQKIITNTLSMFSIQEHDGEFLLSIKDNRYGDALYSFIQGLLKISDVTFLTRERVRSTFTDDFRSLMATTIPEDRREFGWYDPGRDPQGMYKVDCRINGMPTPLFVFALTGDDQTRDATISLLQFEKWGIPHRSIGIFENEEEINRKVLARFGDVCEKLYSNLGTARDRIEKFIDMKN